MPEVTKETLEKIQSEEKGPKVLYKTSALAQERQNKEQPEVKEDITHLTFQKQSTHHWRSCYASLPMKGDLLTTFGRKRMKVEI